MITGPRASSVTKIRQPFQALVPQAFTLEAAEQWALDGTSTSRWIAFASHRFGMSNMFGNR
jgi:hypothetical protein